MKLKYCIKHFFCIQKCSCSEENMQLFELWGKTVLFFQIIHHFYLNEQQTNWLFWIWEQSDTFTSRKRTENGKFVDNDKLWVFKGRKLNLENSEPHYHYTGRLWRSGMILMNVILKIAWQTVIIGRSALTNWINTFQMINAK